MPDTATPGITAPAIRDAAQRGDAAVRALDIPIQLVSGDLQATLRIPNRMSEADFQVLKAVIAANLDAMKPGLVKEAATVPKETEPDAS